MSLMPQFLGSLGHAPEGRLSQEQLSLIERHTAIRLRQGYALHEIVTELAMLGRCITLSLPRCGDGKAAVEPRVLQELHLATLAAAKIFHQHVLEDAQSEKRSARHMARIFARHAPLRERLDEVMELCRVALSADLAVLLLRNDEDELVACATAGSVDIPFEELGGAMESNTFVGRAATDTDGPIEIFDVADDSRQVGEPIRRSGIRSLLGVQVASPALVWGALYVAAKRPAAFSSGQARMIGDLAEMLADHLADAKRRGEARREVEGLQMEIARLADLVATDEERAWNQ